MIESGNKLLYPYPPGGGLKAIVDRKATDVQLERFTRPPGDEQVDRDLLTSLTVTTSIDSERDTPVEMRYAETI